MPPAGRPLGDGPTVTTKKPSSVPQSPRRRSRQPGRRLQAYNWTTHVPSVATTLTDTGWTRPLSCCLRVLPLVGSCELSVAVFTTPGLCENRSRATSQPVLKRNCRGLAGSATSWLGRLSNRVSPVTRIQSVASSAGATQYPAHQTDPCAAQQTMSPTRLPCNLPHHESWHEVKPTADRDVVEGMSKWEKKKMHFCSAQMQTPSDQEAGGHRKATQAGALLQAERKQRGVAAPQKTA